MKIKKVKNQPKQITKYPEIDPKEQDAVESVNEIFKTPLTGAYNWDYIVVDDRIKKLYELGKKLNWNEDFDLDWSQDFPKDQFLINSDIFKTTNKKVFVMSNGVLHHTKDCLESLKICLKSSKSNNSKVYFLKKLVVD